MMKDLMKVAAFFIFLVFVFSFSEIFGFIAISIIMFGIGFISTIDKPKYIQNTSVDISWNQWLREMNCSLFNHQFFVPSHGGYPGLPQSHCYRCGKKGPSAMKKSKDWTKPNGERIF